MKSKSIVFVYLLLFSTALVYLEGCKEDQEKIFKKELSGHAQKGPYAIGSSVSMAELNSSLEQTGKIFTSQIDDNSGSFDFGEISIQSSFVEFSANGYYFDEVRGALSAGPLNLYALSDITNTSMVNVNILTHLERPRVLFLIKNNKTFDEAKEIAQAEILALFGLNSSEIGNSEALDIASDDEGNAILLAVSIIIQHDLSVAQLTELLATISNDLKEDGNVNASIIANLRDAAIELDLGAIRSNLSNRYSEIGSAINIPPFEEYVNKFLEHTGQKPTSITSAATLISTTSVKLNGVVNPNSLTTAVSFEYGKTIEYTNTSPSTPITANKAVPVGATIPDLDPGTTYHYRLKAENSLGITYGSDLTFTTLGKVPTISNLSVSKVFNDGTFNCLINYSVNPNYLSSTVTLEWGTTTAYGNTIDQPAPLTGGSAQSIVTPLSGLESGVTYYFRVKSSNQFGEVQSTGTIQTFAPVADVDGNVYDVLLIGGRYWMAKNLRTTHLNDGTPIALVEDGSAWSSLTSSGYCWYNNDPSDKNPHGALYNWNTVDTKKLCPTGWHIPSNSEWQALINYFGDGYKASTKLQSTETGFGLFRHGMRGSLGPFGSRYEYGLWWTSTTLPDPSRMQGFAFEGNGVVIIINVFYPNSGVPVRCLKD